MILRGVPLTRPHLLTQLVPHLTHPNQRLTPGGQTFLNQSCAMHKQLFFQYRDSQPLYCLGFPPQRGTCRQPNTMTRQLYPTKHPTIQVDRCYNEESLKIGCALTHPQRNPHQTSTS